MIHKINFVLFILVLILVASSCSDETEKNFDLYVDTDSVLDWKLPFEEISSPEKAPILHVHSIDLPENALCHATETFMNTSNLTYTSSPPNTI